MKIQRSEDSGVTIVAVEGVIKLGESARQFSSYLEGLLDEGVASLLVDLAGIDYVDSTGLGELVGYLQRFSEQGKRFALLNPQQRIMSLLKLTQLHEVFPIYTDRAKAVAELSSTS